MPAKELIEIRVSRIIPAPKWKIIRFITRPWEFPTYIPCIKQVAVIQKTRHIIKTKWQIEVEKVPISWIEEDTLALRKNTIYFKAIQGDLEEFRGEWVFKDHPEGTAVSVNVHLRVGIPVIKDFVDAYIQRLFTRNFEAILEALERRLISIRYTSYKRGHPEKLAGFGLIGHPYNFNHLVRYLKSLNPDFKIPSREFLGRIFTTSPSYKLCDISNFKSKTNQLVNGCLIVVTFIPDMLEKDPWAIFSKVVRACKMAERSGVGIVVLGGFASKVGERIDYRIADEVDVAVTTGNTFTVAMVIDGVFKAAELLDVDIASAKVTIVGGSGDIGSACARVLADKVGELTMTGRTKTTLNVITELGKKYKARILTPSDNELAVRDADIVIATASVSASILKIDWFKPGSIICDAGYPKNIPYIATNREDILIFSGGLAKSPTPVSFPVDVGLPGADTIYGCYAEGIILALEKRYENFSFGRGNITPEKVDEIREMGKKHGFTVSDFYWGDRLIDELMIERVKEAKRRNG